MAKDKKDKGASSIANPSEATGGGDGFRLESEDNVGSLFLITPLREDDFTSEEYGTSKIIVADIVEINEKNPAKSKEHEDAFVFGGWTKGSLRSFIGTPSKVLARLAQDASKSRSKKNPAWVLEDASAKDRDLAEEYLASVLGAAMKDMKGASDAGKGKAEKKGKKKK